jgi:hypothetical protein
VTRLEADGWRDVLTLDQLPDRPEGVGGQLSDLAPEPVPPLLLGLVDGGDEIATRGRRDHPTIPRR